MKYVTYNLDWDGSIGEQPYQSVADCGAELEGGVIVSNGAYFGYLHGEDANCTNAIANCSRFIMRELMEQEAINHWGTVIPKNTEQIDIFNGGIKYYGSPYVREDGKISIDLFTEQQ